MKFNKANTLITMATGAIALALVLSVASPYLTRGEADVQVTGTTVKQYNAGEGKIESKYLVFTDQGVFENVDAISYLKFNSSDIQGAVMQPGKFHITYYGFRVPFFSMYKNIISAKRV